MRIHDLGSRREGDLARVSATVTWEDCDRPERQLWIETDGRFADDLQPNPNAFLTASILPAMHRGERRVLVEGEVCPQLRNGLHLAMKLLGTWYGKEGRRPVQIEATEGFRALSSPAQRRASCMSGGIDALTTVRRNHRDFPPDHPGFIRDCVFIHGFDVALTEKLPDRRENSERAISSLRQLLEGVGTTLIPVYTNLRHLEDDAVSRFRESHSSVLAAVGHAFSSRINTFTISSSNTVEHLHPHGSHPLLDPNYSSFDLDVKHDGIEYSRLEKVGFVAEWTAALKTLRVCGDPFRSDDFMNCGRCEKCLRTMVQLLIHGKLKECSTFPCNDVTPEVLKGLKTPLDVFFINPTKVDLETRYRIGTRLIGSAVHMWPELAAGLSEIGRDDLARVIRPKVRIYNTIKAVQDRIFKLVGKPRDG